MDKKKYTYKKEKVLVLHKHYFDNFYEIILSINSNY